MRVRIFIPETILTLKLIVPKIVRKIREKVKIVKKILSFMWGLNLSEFYPNYTYTAGFGKT